jgi:hypothetical protein
MQREEYADQHAAHPFPRSPGQSGNCSDFCRDRASSRIHPTTPSHNDESAVFIGFLELRLRPGGLSEPVALLCKKAGKITHVPHLVSLTRTHAVQPTS